MTVGTWTWPSATIRSPVLSSPTTRPSSTTGPASMPRSTRVVMAASTPSVGAKDTTSVVITSRTGWERGTSFLRELGQGGGQVHGEVAGHQAAAPG